MVVRLGCFLVATSHAQRFGNQAPGGRLRLAVARRERERLAVHALGLSSISLAHANLTYLDPQQRIVRLDAQGAFNRCCGESVVAAVGSSVCLRNERGGCGAEAELLLRGP